MVIAFIFIFKPAVNPIGKCNLHLFDIQKYCGIIKL